MVKVTKNLSNIPKGLEQKIIKKFVENMSTTSAYDDKYNKTYKLSKTNLEKIYNNKCCYCEKTLEDSFKHIEHYRPKDTYWWLSLSYDNLLLCCDRCNNYKSTHFEVEHKKKFNKKDINNLHNLAIKYNKVEKPKLIHPEIDQIDGLFYFDTNGKIYGIDDRMKYTIEKCKIDRKEANSQRKAVLDKFRTKIEARISENKISEIDNLIADFINEANNNKEIYIAFRKWCIENLDTIIENI